MQIYFEILGLTAHLFGSINKVFICPSIYLSWFAKNVHTSLTFLSFNVRFVRPVPTLSRFFKYFVTISVNVASNRSHYADFFFFLYKLL